MRKKNPENFDIIEKYVDGHIDRYGICPSNREIANGTGLSLSTVSRYLSLMRENGVVEYSGHRGIQTRKQMQAKINTLAVPVLGQVSCGIPKYAESNIDEYVCLPEALFGRGDYFLLRASGDSMIEAGINDGDMVLVRHQNYANSGQIVVALLSDEEATLKTYYPEKEHIRLHPENSRLSDILVKDCVIQGVAVNVIKNL